MRTDRSLTSLILSLRHLTASLAAIAALTLPVFSATIYAQEAPPTPTDNVRYGYTVHQSVELGGHIADHSGSDAVYATMINLHSGPRILNYFLDMRAVNASHAFLFDHLSTNGFGYGGDPNSVSMLNASKGRIYDFRASFRRDRQYFDYDLLSNPLIPPSSVPFIPVLNSPHRYNTVRRMTDLNLTLAPLSPISVHFGYSRNVSAGPSYSTLYYGADALLFQNWRNTTDSWVGGVEWKPVPHTSFTFDEFVNIYKGDTSWQLAGLDYQLSDGTPVALGVDLSSVWNAPCAGAFLPGGAVKPTCSAYLSYSRSAPTRTFSPTEQLHFQSTSIPHFTFNGRMLYSHTTSNLNNFNEVFNGLNSRVSLRESVITGSARARRINANGDLSVVWQVTPKIMVSNLFDYWNYHVPGVNAFSETDYAGNSLLVAPGAATTTATTTDEFMNQKTKTNTTVLAWDVVPRARVSVGYRYRTRLITNPDDNIPIHENWALFGVALRPTPNWRVNLDVDAMYADNAFTRISPRHLQHYRLRTTYKPQTWLTLAGSMNIRESRDNVATVNHRDHNRDYSLGASITPNEKWSVDLNYGYDSIYSTTLECYTSTPAPPDAGVAPQVCIDGGTPLANNSYYDAPTQFGSFGFTFVPQKRIHLAGGYRMSAVDGHTDVLNIRQVPGGLQSEYQSPYGSVALDLARNWMWKADYNYYGYGEGSPIGPTAPRSFRGNVYTLGVHYAF